VSTGRAATANSGDLDAVLGRYRALLGEALLQAIHAVRASAPSAAETNDILDEFYGQIEYHHGWRAPDLRPKPWRPGKLIRPTLLLLACEVAAGQRGQPKESDGGRQAAIQRAIPAALAVELVHNFSLVHDDIEDGDEERHHQPTLWKVWGVPLAINTGDGIFALARLQLSHLRARGVPAETIIELSARLDATCIELCEGQHLDMRFEGRQDVSVAMYLDMIARKTAALMDCAARMGSLIGAPENQALSAQLGAFGRALGIGFQLRDDMLGIWSAQALGMTEAGDLRHKKMSLPVISALEDATSADQRALARIYGQRGPVSDVQIATLLEILERSGARERTRTMLREQCDLARALLDGACANTTATDACAALGAILDFVAAEGI
jgi:geranylgeranyl diphosphate synthase type I